MHAQLNILRGRVVQLVANNQDLTQAEQVAGRRELELHDQLSAATSSLSGMIVSIVFVFRMLTPVFTYAIGFCSCDCAWR
jgi:hypothetical protein